MPHWENGKRRSHAKAQRRNVIAQVMGNIALGELTTSKVIRWGAIKSDAGVQGLPCEGMCRQGKPCTPDVISNAAQLVCITFNRIPEQIREVSFSRDDALNPDFSGLYRVAKHIVPIRYEADTLPKLRAQLDGLGKPCDFLASLP